MESELHNNRYGETSRIEMSHHKEEASYIAAEHQRKLTVEIDHNRLADALYQSLEQRTSIAIMMYDIMEQLMVIGTVEAIDPEHNKFRVDGEWFMLKDIMDIKQA